ncbi:F-box/kelch-repeat protein [Cardamine amara subsp. amara]|uniref:F-box/kelch-repeat protein n=1 Tax=Cardamine amara subsp. amara TaxID=228776 RepID=A0ABD1BVT7_CARAN
MAEPETKNKTSSSIMPDWSQLLEELLHLISKLIENCFDVVHARSVCSSWRSSFPFPCSLIHTSCSLPKFDKFPLESDGLCTLKKVPLFLFRLRARTTDAAEFLIGGIGRDESEDHMQLPSSIQCSVKVKIPGSVPTLMNMLDCQIFPLGHQYRIIGCNPISYRGVATLPLTKERGGGGFVVLLNCSQFLLVLTSAEMRWKQLENVPKSFCWSLVTFRGKFYANFLSKQIVVIDPYSLEVTLLLPSPQKPVNHLVPSGNDKLFLVEVTFLPIVGLDFDQLILRVSRLDEEAGKWIEISDLGDRVLFINELGNFSCSAKELPHDCGVSGNSILITHGGSDKLTFAYKYGVHTGNAEDDLNCWRYSRENRVMKPNTSFPVIALQVER